jgi:hypothetical protein
MPVAYSYKAAYINESGSKCELPISIVVDKDGLFSAIVPDWIESNIYALLPDRNDPFRDRHKFYGVYIARPKEHLHIYCKIMEKLKICLHEALVQYSAPVVVKELVIRYNTKVQAAAYELPDGRLFANGYVADKIGKAEGLQKDERFGGYGNWAKELKTESNNPAYGGYSVQVGAAVQVKVTTTRGESVKIVYESPSGFTHSDVNVPEAAEKLNSFIGLSLSNSSYYSDRDIILQEIPYTDEAAEFFYRIMIGIAEMGLKMARFFADKETMIARIQARNTPLLGNDA